MIAPGQPMNRDQAFRLALMVERRARTDARTWVNRLPQQALLLARGRAEQVIEPSQNPRDPLRVALTREWYVRVFEDQVRHDLDQVRPELAVTAVETEHVAECLTDGKVYRIHGPGGSIVLNPAAAQDVPGQNNYNSHPEESARPVPPERWHRQQLERLAQEQDRRRAEDNRIVGAAWDQLSPDERTAFAAWFHQTRGTTGPAAYPTAEPQLVDRAASEPAPVYSATDTGQRNPVTGTPAEAAAAVFDQQSAAGVAEVNAARLLVAQAFPRTAQKPPTITTTGETRSGTQHTQAHREDRSR